MSLCQTIRREAELLKVDLSEAEINRIAGTLRFVGGSDNMDLLRQEIKRFLKEVQQPERVIEVANRQPAQGASFRQIDASLESGTCPRCGRKMRDVKLADYTPARYCEGECRIVLWLPEKK